MRFDVHWFEELGSTNAFLKAWLADEPGLPAGTVVAARRQTAGRGRCQRVWTSGPREDLTFSFLVRHDGPVEWLPASLMATALAVSEALDACGLTTSLKWPNDVLVEDKKICGILAEYVADAKAAGHAVVVGVGINLGMDEGRARSIDRPATSVFIETGRKAAPEAVLDQTLVALAHWLADWRRGGFGALREAWMAKAVHVGKWVSVGEGETRRSGVLKGFGEHGEVLLELEEGSVVPILFGDVGA